LAFSEQVQRAIGEGVKWIDSMRGRYPHKTALGGETEPIKTILLYHKRRSALAKVRALRAAAFAYDALYYRVYRGRIAPLLHMRPKPLRQWWLRTHTLLGAELI
jgi:hypothetical protein